MAGKEVTVVDVVAPTEVNGERLPGESLLNREEDAQENMEKLKAELDRVSSALLNSELKAKRADELEEQLYFLQEELRSLHEKILEKEKVEASMDNDSEVAKAVAEKEALEAARKELTEDLEQMRGRCVDLESELKLSREEFGRVDKLVADVLGKNTELEEKLRSLEQLLEESKEEEASSFQKKLELQDLVRAADTALEEARLELQERDLELKAANQKKMELEDQLNFSESKYDDADRSLQEYRSKISELESALALKSELEVKLENRIEELEQEMETIEQKRKEAESESEKYSDMASELKIELEVAGKRERELTGSLNATMEEKRESEKALHDFVDELHDAEDLIEVLRGELSATQGKLQGTENDHKDAQTRESEILEKLKCAEEKLEQQERVSEEATATLRKEIELQLEVLNNKDSEVKFLRDELQIAENQKLVNGERAAEAEGKVADLVEELDLSSKNLADTESKVGELQELLDSSMETAEELRNQLARSHERQSEVEASFLQAQAEINEAGLKLSHKEMEAKDLSELLDQTEEKLKIYEVQLHESDSRVESTEGKLREASVKMAYQENMIEKLEDALSQLETQNGDPEGEKMKLKAELAELESKLNGLQEELSASLEERNSTVVLLESQVSSIKEEEQAMESELIATQGKLWNAEDDLKDAAIKEDGLLEKLKSAEGQVYQNGKALEEANARNMVLQSLSARLKTDIELKLQEVTKILNSKEAEIKSFAEKLQIVTNAKMDYQEQAAQAADKVAALEHELVRSSTKLGSLESKVGELQELPELAIVEKQEIARQLASSMNTGEELKNQLAMSHKLQSEAEARFLQAQTELNEATQRLNQKEYEAKELSEELSEIKERLNRYQVQLHNSAAMAESRKLELERIFAELLDEEKKTELLEAKLSQLQTHNGNLEEANVKLKEKVAESEAKLNGLQEELSATLNGKGDVADSFQSQIALIMEQKQVLERELIATRGKLQSIEGDLKASEIREDEIVKRLKYAEGQAEQQGKALEEANAKNTELESLNETLRKDIELKHQEAMGTLDSKEAEAKLFAEKLQTAEAQLAQAADKVAALEDELDRSSTKLASLESLNEELKKMEANSESLSNKKLQLRNPHIKPCGHQSEVEARLLQVQMELHEKTEILARMELEAKALNARLGQLEEHNGALVEEKKKFEEELERALIRLNDLQAELSAKAAEKDAAVENFNSSFKMIEDLKQEWALERQCFESKIASIIEQKEHINESGESYESLKAELENLKVKAAETTALQTRVEELEEQLLVTKERSTKEMENVRTNFAAREIEPNSKLEQHTQKTQYEDAPIEKKEKNSEMAQVTEDEIQQATEDQVNEPEQKLQEQTIISQEKETKPGAIVVAGKTKKVQANEGKNIKVVIGVALMSVIMGLILKKK